MFPTSLPADPGKWLYDLGVPRFHADAFAEYVRTNDTVYWSLSVAKQSADYDPRFHALYRAHGSKVTP
jgi:hypothetical protein